MPIEQLDRTGTSRSFSAFLRDRCGWSAERIALIDDGFARYWSRSAALAARTPTWMPPRRRNLAVVAEPSSVRPYVQLLNTTTWLLYACDVDPAASDPEFLAYLLAHGDRMAATGEVTQAAVHNAAWWFDRTDAECAAFAAAAARSTRPDADAFRALAAAIPWLKQIRHEHLDPPRIASPHRPIPGTGLLVPRAIEPAPPALVARWTTIARDAVARFHAHWRRSDPAAVARLVDRLAHDRPPLLVVGQREEILWQPDHPERFGALRSVLRQADGVAVDAIAADLAVVADHTRRFHAALTAPDALPAPAANTTHAGLAFLHRERRMIAYGLFEPGMERLQGPDLPYERAMLGARTAHEWAHLADTAGWVPRVVAPERWRELRATLAAQLDAAVAAAPAVVRRITAADLAALADGRPIGEAMVRVLVSRLPDFRANLLARRFMSDAERETYVRHNVRTLHPEYPPARLWRMLLRYLFEYQYLRFSWIDDGRGFFMDSTSCRDDCLAAGLCDDAAFDALAAAMGALCDAYAVDETRFRFEPA